ncbi:MAG: glycoside hydrolase family 2 protein [Clostridiaceae bacterium]|nr:glycoside hydrolase family 2 protein [Clostridiaceae bacterium]
MRTILNFNEKWAFTKQAAAVPTSLPADWERVNLPHTWNGVDGQDGGNDYYRGAAYYAKIVNKAELPVAERFYLELQGANSSADVYVDGKHLARHDGGYSTWRVDLTEHLGMMSLLVVKVDNSANNTVYPQMADFTFYGGLYRDVQIICVSESHFDLDHYGSPGLAVTPEIVGTDAKVTVETWVTNMKPGQTLRYALYTGCGREVTTTETAETKVELEIKDVRLWHGRKDPYLYIAKIELLEGGNIVDNVSTRFGCRRFEIDPDNGFILNGEEYPLRGVSRHQDRPGIGNALLPEHHEEDIDLICEMGATTVRLAHYQHDQYFYDLCDERGMVVWAEIPYISKHMPTGRENTISQMKELVIQSHNHPSIVVWGLSNEITIGGSDEDLLENHRILNDLCHELDKTRLTAVAAVSMCKIDDPYLSIPDVVSYNHYFGWYGGETGMNGPWFDNFHATHPNIPIGCSEYGCEGLDWHTSDPKQGDYTEEYQTYYHEELIKQFFTRKYLWATHVWNMFDFGSDARAEGGTNGRNHKGLVSFDRKYKKDSFYAYKAWLSDEPFVHLTSKRYTDRVEEVTRVTVYSNLPEVELFANGVSLGKKTAKDHFFRFEVPNVGETRLEAVAGDCRDESVIRKVKTFNEAYRLVDKGAVLNWFDVTEPEGFLSLNDKMGTVLKTCAGMQMFVNMIRKLMNGNGNVELAGFEINAEMLGMLSSFTVLRLFTMMTGMFNVKFTKEQLLGINEQLNRIPRPRK